MALRKSRKEMLADFSDFLAPDDRPPEPEGEPEAAEATADRPAAFAAEVEEARRRAEEERRAAEAAAAEAEAAARADAEAAERARAEAAESTRRIAERSSGSTDDAPENVPASGTPSHRGRPLGEILLERGFVEREALLEALLKQPEVGAPLGSILVGRGLITQRQLSEVLAEQLGLRTVDLRKEKPERDAVDALPEGTARLLNALGFRRTPEGLEVAVADPLHPNLVSQLEEASGLPVLLLVSPVDDIQRSIETSYTSTVAATHAIQAFEAQALDRPRAEQTVTQVVDENAPVVQVVNLILEQAVRDRASDVHVEPLDGRVRVRVRTDGALHEVLSLPESMGQPLLSRIKVMADLNIVERRRPQDGQIETTVAGHPLDVRVSTTATVFGEKCVMRLLDKRRALYKLPDLGMPDGTYERFEKLVRSPYGMVVCAGPTGSGKTTTLYASLMEINREEINVTTIEDPVEYVFPEINQIQINEQAGITFAGGLRSILRQDPDAILVGEIRDVETARIAVQAALTGHLVLSSIHATDSISALHRFIDMGIEEFLIASSLLGVVAQRLVRRICESCKVRYDPTPEELAYYERNNGPETDAFYAGEGCNFCGGTGFFNRVGVYEILHLDDEIKQLVIEGAPSDLIRKTALRAGMRTLADEAVALVAEGTTTIGEVLRTVYML